MSIKDEMARHGVTVDTIMDALDDPRFFSWKDLKPLLDTDKRGFFFTSMRSVGKSTVIGALLISEFLCLDARYLYIRRTRDMLYATNKAFFDDAIDLINGDATKMKSGEVELPFTISYFHCEAGEYHITVNWKDEDYTPEKYDKNGELIDMTPEEIAEAKAKDLKARSENCGGCLHLQGYGKARSGFNKRNMNNILYDEFMAEQAMEYLGSDGNRMVEWQDIMSIFMSIAREKGNPFKDNVTMFFLGNNALDFNPIMLGSGVNMFMAQSPGARMINPKIAPWLYYNIEPSEDFIELQKQSLAYKWMQFDPTLRDYNFENKAKTGTDNDVLIEKDIPKGCRYMGGIYFNSKQYGIYYRDRDGMVYVSKKFMPGKYCEALDLASYYNNNTVLLVQHWKKSGMLTLIYKRFLLKKVRFCDRSTRTLFLQYLDFIPKG